MTAARTEASRDMAALPRKEQVTQPPLSLQASPLVPSLSLTPASYIPSDFSEYLYTNTHTWTP